MNKSRVLYNKVVLVVIFFAVCIQSVFSQSSPLSPYSRFGIGDIAIGQSPRNMAMGGVSTALVSNRNISVFNPASFLNLDSNAVIFEISFNVHLSQIKQKIGEEILKSNSNAAALSSVTFNFPILNNYLAAGIGLQPVASIDYNVNRIIPSDGTNGEHLLTNSGSGGLGKAYFGIAGGYKYFSLGAKANYIFGSTTRLAELSIADTLLFPYATTTRMKNYLTANGFSIDFGFQYKQPIGNRFLLGLGASYTPQYNIFVERKYALFSEGLNYLDTIVDESGKKGKIVMPQFYTVGISFEELGKWVISSEYRYHYFSQYKEYDNHDPNLTDARSVHFGAELIGDRIAKNYFSRMFYRFGATYGTNYVAYNQNVRNQWSVALGFGFPIKTNYSRIDVTFEYGQNGDIKKGQIQEDFGRISIGFFGFERWFYRRKFN
ncbi:MAG: hypothetical protein LBC89_01200 [Bacteroidales bacterium]|jgi:hypothetical protein|nr:hypothetical protein [Bacteroidales bacterium]